MTGLIESSSPDGVLVSSDAGTPSALQGALEALELPEVLEWIAGHAVGPLGADSIRARRPLDQAALIRTELTRVEELARLARTGRGLVAEAVPPLAQPLARLRISGSVLDGPELLAFRRTLTAARLVLAELARVRSDAPSTAPLEQPAPEKSWERRLEQALDDSGLVLDTASPALASARSDVRTARERLVQKLEALLRGLGQDGGVTLRDGRYVIPVSRDLRNRPDGLVLGESASGATLYLEPAAAIPLQNALREAEGRATREELRVLRTLTEMLRPGAETVAGLHAMCVAVDDLAARANWAVAVDGTAPAVSPAPAELRIVRGRHPLLLAAMAHADSGPRDPVVPFDLVLEGPERTVVLSGPNTGGKSVLLKAVGLLAALTQSGIVPPVGAGSAFPVFQRLFADIGDRQSIAESLSTFSARLALQRRILDQADAATLVLLDEIGGGTDPAEGGALAWAVLLTLTRRGAITLATTHLGALKELASHTRGVVNASLQFDAATLQPTYRLQKGVPGRSYGLAIARRLGLPEEVLRLAEEQVPEGERSLDSLLAAVEARAREQEVRETELQARLAEAEGRAQFLAAQAEAQAIREATLRRQERDAERERREQARAYLLQARAQVEEAIAKAAAGSALAAREARRTLEEGAAAEAAALAALAEAPPGSGGAPPALEPGQRVRLGGGTTGEVVELRGDGQAVVRVGSLKLIADPASLTPVAGGGERPSRRNQDPSVHAAAEASYEVDLRGLTGDEAEQAVLAALDAAILAEQPFLRIIHGKGTGVVRERVRQVVQRDHRIRTHAFAPANQGGTGVTVVEFAG